MRSRFTTAVILLAWMVRSPFAVSAPGLPPDSVYQLSALTLTDQDGNHFAFSSLKGEPHLVGMFYTTCTMVCPMEIETLKRVQRKMADRLQASVILVSFDPARDDVASLHAEARKHRVSSPSFRLTRADQGDERMLAGVLGIAYRRLPNGSFSHNVPVSLIDADGRILTRFDASTVPDASAIESLIELGRRSANGSSP